MFVGKRIARKPTRIGNRKIHRVVSPNLVVDQFSDKPNRIAVCFGWTFSKYPPVSKKQALLVSAGKFDTVCTVTVSGLTTMFGNLSKHVEGVNDELKKNYSECSEIAWIFYSGGGALMYPVLRKLQLQQKGQIQNHVYIFDSSPVPLGVTHFVTWAKKKIGIFGILVSVPVAIYMYFLGYKRISSSNNYIRVETAPPRTLFLGSPEDSLVPMEYQQTLVTCRNKGQDDTSNRHLFRASQHLQHDVDYPEEYYEVVRRFLENAGWKQ